MSDFLHYIFPGMSETKERKLAREILTQLKGGEGSGNFGHAGRPGEVGGSAREGNLAEEINKRIPGSNVYIINDASNLVSGRTQIAAVSISGINKGIILSTTLNQGHSKMIHEFDEKDTIDNWVRFEVQDHNLTAHIDWAGVVITDNDSKSSAINNIYKSTDRLVNKGLSRDTKLIIYGRNLDTLLTTTVKMFKGNFLETLPAPIR